MEAKETPKTVENAAKKDPGVDYDLAMDGKVTPSEVKAMVEEMNNNHAGDSDFNPSAV